MGMVTAAVVAAVMVGAANKRDARTIDATSSLARRSRRAPRYALMHGPWSDSGAIA
jgi:hypothetical protein